MDAATYNNSQPFIPEIRIGKVVRVYDGDTITIAAKIIIEGKETSKPYRFSVRLRGIDSPELKTKNPKEKELAVQSRDKLASFIMGEMVTLENVAFDKYGRILAEVITKDGENVSKWMLENKLAVEYDGGTKHRPAEWSS
jgi:endonuclease YncB( thermonuclease family)